jgi:hypothetical protein
MTWGKYANLLFTKCLLSSHGWWYSNRICHNSALHNPHLRTTHVHRRNCWCCAIQTALLNALTFGDDSLLGYCAVLSRRHIPTFQRRFLPSFSLNTDAISTSETSLYLYETQGALHQKAVFIFAALTTWNLLVTLPSLREAWDGGKALEFLSPALDTGLPGTGLLTWEEINSGRRVLDSLPPSLGDQRSTWSLSAQ